MKMYFRFLLFSFCVVAMSATFTSCESDDSNETKSAVITFEDVTVNSSGYWNGSTKTGTHSSYESWGSVVDCWTGSFKSGDLTCSNSYFESAGFNWWSGMACSSKHNQTAPGVANQYSVYATGGASGSSNFGLIGSDSASCSFNNPVNIKSLMINNSTYVYYALKDGNDGNENSLVKKFTAGDYFEVTITGYDAQKKKTAAVVVPLADFRNQKSYICQSWTSVDLSSLGTVKSLVFSFKSTDSGMFGMNTPAYVCIDNIVYNK